MGGGNLAAAGMLAKAASQLFVLCVHACTTACPPLWRIAMQAKAREHNCRHARVRKGRAERLAWDSSTPTSSCTPAGGRDEALRAAAVRVCVCGEGHCIAQLSG
jgi:hypothetical protein